MNFLGTTGAFAVGCATVQHIKTLHHLEVPGTLDKRSAIFRSFLMGPSARKADVVIANSKVVKDAVANYWGVSPERIVIVPEAVDHDIFSPRRAHDDFHDTLLKYGVSEPYVLFVSSLWKYKNAHGLINAFAELLSSGLRTHHLIIVGGLSNKQYRDELVTNVREKGIERCVHFLGHVSDRREIRNLYVGADVFVYPSYYETFGLTLLESMACGTPIVASNRGSIPEVSGGAALLIEPDDYTSMAEAISQLLRQPALRDENIRKGIAQAAKYTWERTARETLVAYRSAYQASRRTF
jgi:glycosyltransferase involved in cell wall biosynthesis